MTLKTYKATPFSEGTCMPENITVYVSGAMSGYANHNYPAFEEATKKLREQGFTVISPHENDGGDPSAGDWKYFMRQDVRHVSYSDIVVVLPGWEKSRGARVEVFIGKVLGLSILDYPSLNPTDPKVIGKTMPLMVKDFCEVMEEDEGEYFVDEAKRLVGGDRQNAYGHPYTDFLRTSNMWTGLLIEKLKPGARIEPKDVGMMMVCLKLSRHMNKAKRDNKVDAVGYLITVDMVEQYEKKLKEESND